MQTIPSQLERAFRAAITAAFGFDADPVITVAQNEKFGDYQSNAAMGLAKQVKERTGQNTNPRAVAEQIKAKLDLGGMAGEVSIAGPGFINVRLSPDWLARQLTQAAGDERLGVEQPQRPQRVVVDYSGPNIAKQMHVGHLRSTIIGDAVARTNQFQGHDVIRQNHLGDWGTQFGRVVLAMWAVALFERTGNRAKYDELVERVQAASRELARVKAEITAEAPGAATRADPESAKAKEAAARAEFARAVAAVARDIEPWAQRFLDEDPHDEVHFRPYLESQALDLDELERAYVFVSTVVDNPVAAEVSVTHRDYGRKSLAELPRLVTTFVQNPENPRYAAEQVAWQKARDVTLAACNEIYARLRVQLADPSVQREPLERGESFYHFAGLLPPTVADLLAAGVAVKSQGAVVVPVEGFETPLIIQKSDGSYLYGTTDLAAVRFRAGTLRADRVLYFTDSRQSQHFAQVFAAAAKAGWVGGTSLEHAPFGTMLGEDGKPFKTRSGDTVKLKDLLDEAEERALRVVAEKNPELPEAQKSAIARAVGIGAVKYADLSKDRTSDYVFSWERMLSFDGNTAPYLQNAYVRVKGIFRKARASGIEPTVDYAAIRLQSPFELALAKHVLRLGEALELVTRESKPHYLCGYLYDLATRFHAFFENCPVLQSEEPTRSSRLALCDLVGRVLARGLDLLGIEHPEQM